jgi:hypothetical protein
MFKKKRANEEYPNIKKEERKLMKEQNRKKNNENGKIS